jgi:hypothetical protein
MTGAVMNRRVVITGAGLVTPVGLDLQESWTGLLAGRSGAGPITQFDASSHAVRFACEVKGFDPTLYIDRKEVKRTDRFSHFAIASAVQAMRQAGLDEERDGIDHERFGVVIGSGIGGIHTFEDQHSKLIQRGPGPRVALLRPDVHLGHRGGAGVDPLRRQGPQLLHRLRLRIERARAGERLPQHQVGRGGHHDRRAARRRPFPRRRSPASRR